MQRENSSHICSRNTKKHIPIKLCLGTFEYQTSTTLWKIPVQSSNTNNIKLKLPAMRNPIHPTQSQSAKCDILKQARWNEIVKHASVKYVLSNCAPSQEMFFLFFLTLKPLKCFRAWPESFASSYRCHSHSHANQPIENWNLIFCKAEKIVSCIKKRRLKGWGGGGRQHPHTQKNFYLSQSKMWAFKPI